MRTGVADHCLTAWLLRPILRFIQFFYDDIDVADPRLTAWLLRLIILYAAVFSKMTPTGIEPVLPP